MPSMPMLAPALDRLMKTAFRVTICIATLCAIPFASEASAATPVVPGSGVEITQVGDDFEDPEWHFFPNGAKSSYNIDEVRRLPGGQAKNGRWYEGVKRGYPDVVKRVPTPKGGLPGSEHALLLKTLRTGIPGRVTHDLQQDDFVCNIHQRIGSTPVSQTPSFVVRVFLPPIDTWENRTGPSLGIRAALETMAMKENEGFLAFGKSMQNETYWPGMFINLESETDRGREYDSAFISVRGAYNGADFRSIPIKVTGWWTFGMSVTPDGQVHYYASPGVDDLTADDYLTSQYPYGYRAHRMKTFFFNVCNGDNGRTWSTSWIIDDAKFYKKSTRSAQRSNNRR